MKAEATHTFSGVSHRETENAILVELEDGSEVWIPFSQVSSIVREPKGGEVTLTISRWIAGQKGML